MFSGAERSAISRAAKPGHRAMICRPCGMAERASPSSSNSRLRVSLVAGCSCSGAQGKGTGSAPKRRRLSSLQSGR